MNRANRNDNRPVVMRRCRRLLDQTARLRFPRDAADRDRYVARHLEASEYHDERYYWIERQAFARLRDAVVAEHGPRPRLRPPRETTPAPSRLRQAVNVARAAGGAVKSVAKTAAGIGTTTGEQFDARLAVCAACPGNHAVLTLNGTNLTPPSAERRDALIAAGATVYTCGPMLASMRESGGATCGCILKRKARDRAQDCPNGWWPALPRADDDRSDTA